MEFKEYQHIERFGTDEVQGIEIGACYVFPKIDGTNASLWLGDDGGVQAGSRKRLLSLNSDNAGFCNEMTCRGSVVDYLAKHPTHRLFGEWLVPHSLKTYRDDAWRRFYVFDVCLDKEDGSLEYLPYDVYKPLLEEFELDYICPIKIIKNGDYETFVNCLEANTFLIKDGCGCGEGVVIKNYDFYNRFHRQTWAKIVTSEFKEKHAKTMGAPILENKLVEEEIVDDYVTTAFVEKEHGKIVAELGGWQSKYIPMLLSRVFYELVNEETWNILKKHKNPTINFKTLNAMTIHKVKAAMPQIFG